MIEVGVLLFYLGKIFDVLDKSFVVIKEVMKKVDFLIIMGGVLVGDFDFLFVIYEKFGVDVFFNKVVMCLGSVIMVVYVNDMLLFGLLGNFLVCYVGFELFVKLMI